jgi:hypothetical protein
MTTEQARNNAQDMTDDELECVLEHGHGRLSDAVMTAVTAEQARRRAAKQARRRAAGQMSSAWLDFAARGGW